MFPLLKNFISILFSWFTASYKEIYANILPNIGSKQVSCIFTFIYMGQFNLTTLRKK